MYLLINLMFKQHLYDIPLKKDDGRNTGGPDAATHGDNEKSEFEEEKDHEGT